jgi:hypothetical protein
MLLVTFCLRLACGLLGCLLLIPSTVSYRFFRAHLLTALALLTGAAVFLREDADLWLGLALAAGILLAFAGSVAWSVEGHPGGRLLIALDLLAAAAVLGLMERAGTGPVWLRATEDVTSAALLGTATTAMLVGHSYLISPTLSLTPLLRLLAALFVAVCVRMVVAGVVGLWTVEAGWGNLKGETILWLLLRWGLGFAVPLVLGWMAREAAKIRSTQSATGILYVVVIFCFLGELTGQLLLATSAAASIKGTGPFELRGPVPFIEACVKGDRHP